MVSFIPSPSVSTGTATEALLEELEATDEARLELEMAEERLDELDETTTADELDELLLVVLETVLLLETVDDRLDELLTKELLELEPGDEATFMVATYIAVALASPSLTLKPKVA